MFPLPLPSWFRKLTNVVASSTSEDILLPNWGDWAYYPSNFFRKEDSFVKLGNITRLYPNLGRQRDGIERETLGSRGWRHVPYFFHLAMIWNFCPLFYSRKLKSSLHWSIIFESKLCSDAQNNFSIPLKLAKHAIVCLLLRRFSEFTVAS